MELRLEPRTPLLHCSGQLSPGLVNKCGEMGCVCLSCPFPLDRGQDAGGRRKKGEAGEGRGGLPHTSRLRFKKKIQTPRFSPSHPSPCPTPQVQAAKGQVQVRFRPRSNRLRLQSVSEPPGGAPAILARARGSGDQSSRRGGRGANATQTCTEAAVVNATSSGAPGIRRSQNRR